MTVKRCAPYLFAVVSLTSTVPVNPTALAQTPPKSPAVPKTLANERTSRGSTAGNPRPSSAMLERSLGWSAGVLAIGAVAVIISRKFARPAGSIGEATGERARIMSRVQLTSRQAVHVVRIGQRTLVIGTGPQGSPVALAEWMSDPAKADATEFTARLSIDADESDTSISPTNTNGAAA